MRVAAGIAVSCLLGMCVSVRAGIVVDNFGLDSGSVAANGQNAYQAFHTDSGAYVLDSISVLGGTSGPGAGYLVADDNGAPTVALDPGGPVSPSLLIFDPDVPNLGPPHCTDCLYTYTPSTAFTLQPDTTYWFEAVGPATSSNVALQGFWGVASALGGSGPWTLVGSAQAYGFASPKLVLQPDVNFLIQINARPVPLPPTAWLMLSGLAALGTFARTPKSGLRNYRLTTSKWLRTLAACASLGIVCSRL